MLPSRCPLQCAGHSSQPGLPVAMFSTNPPCRSSRIARGGFGSICGEAIRDSPSVRVLLCQVPGTESKIQDLTET